MMRKPSEDEAEDYREQARIERYEKKEADRIYRERARQRIDPAYVPSWEREED